MKVILLAAGRGRRFGRRTRVLPKCLIPLSRRGETLLSRYLDSFRRLRLRDVVLVVGHQKEKVLRECARKADGLPIRFVTNKDFKKGSIVSLCTASHELNDDCLIMDADVFFQTAALKRLLQKKSSAFLIDPRSNSAGEEMMVMAEGRRPLLISKQVTPGLRILGEATGFLKLRKPDAVLLGRILKKMVHDGKTDVEYEDAYNELMKDRALDVVTIRGFWTEMDFEADLRKIRARL